MENLSRQDLHGKSRTLRLFNGIRNEFVSVGAFTVNGNEQIVFSTFRLSIRNTGNFFVKRFSGPRYSPWRALVIFLKVRFFMMDFLLSVTRIHRFFNDAFIIRCTRCLRLLQPSEADLRQSFLEIHSFPDCRIRRLRHQ